MNGSNLKYYLAIVFLWALFPLSAQDPGNITRSEIVEMIQGQPYYIHLVKPGQTMYSICRVYEVTTDDLLSVNPQLKEGLRPNQVLKIPQRSGLTPSPGNPQTDTTETSPSMVLKDTLVYYIRHEVLKGETLYGLSKQYGVSVDDLYLLNPGLKTDGLKKNAIIKIPVNGPDAYPEVHSGTLAMTTYVNPQVKDTIEIRIEPVAEPKKTTSKGETFRIALLLPFYLNEVDEIDHNDTVDIPPPSLYKSFSFIEFYEGALIALDSLTRAGMNINAYVYDIAEDASKARSLIAEPEFRKMDLIIGPVFKSSFDVIALFAQENHIPVVNPFTKRSDVVTRNPYVIKIQSSPFGELDQMVQFLTSAFPGANFMIIYQNRYTDQETGVYLRDKLSRYFGSDLHISHKDLYTSLQNIVEADTSFHNELPDTIYTDNQLITSQMIYANPFDSLHISNQVREVYFNEEGISGIIRKSSLVRENVIICLSTDRVFVADLMSHIQSLAEKYKMTMVGMSEWNNADLDLEYAMKLDLHLITTDFVDYEEPKVKRFIAEFRNRFRNDPKQGKYAFEGYDLLVYFMNTLNSHGKNFIRYLPEIRYTGLQSGYNFKKRGEEGGYENEYAGIIRFKDYSIIRIR